MYVTMRTTLDINDNKQPSKHDYIDEWVLKNEANEILTSMLINMAINFARTKNTDEITNFVRRRVREDIERDDPSYIDQAQEDACDLIKGHFVDEIIEQLIDNEEASDDFNNDYNDGDAIFHDNIVDRSYSTEESMELLNELYRYEEEDSGLWEGQEWDDILQIKAAYTYGNAVWSEMSDIINEINDIDMDEICDQAIRKTLRQIDKKRLSQEDRRAIKKDGLKEWLAWTSKEYDNNLHDELSKWVESCL